MASDDRDTRAEEYTRRLIDKQGAWWKRALDVRGVYGWNLRRLEPGFTLDVGCGIGRNLAHLRGNGVGVDHNQASVEECRRRGFEAWLPEELHARRAGSPPFDSMLLAHVVEHMPPAAAVDLVREYLPYVRPGGQLVVITPQVAGYRSDATHVAFTDFDGIDRLLAAVGATPTRRRSFPFPVPAGRVFKYNEYVVAARLPG